MKKCVLIFVLIICLVNVSGFIYANDLVSPISTNNNIIDRIGVEGPLEFNQTVFKLAWSEKPNDTYYAQEYIPDGENLDKFNQMLAIHIFITDKDPKMAFYEKIAEISKGKTTVFSVYGDQKTTFILDFIVKESKLFKLTLVEYDIYRYQQVDIGNNNKALMVYMYCRRSYDNDTKTFLDTLGNINKGLIDQMSKMDAPIITIKK